MKGDFARYTFDPSLHYSRVLQQQGRVLLEADWNEATAIQLHLLRTLIGDLVGPCWAVGKGFAITTTTTNANGGTAPARLSAWQLSRGHFYVDGILCVNPVDCTLATQPSQPTPDDPALIGSSNDPHARLALWLDVWERHLCAVEAPESLDPALEGVETASRAQVVWQLRVLDLTQPARYVQDVVTALSARASTDAIAAQLATLKQLMAGTADPAAGNDPACALARGLLDARATYAVPGLCARLATAAADADPCAIAPDAAYRGCENQLYRVEIHDAGPAGTATFKWSRENGSVVFAVSACGPATPSPDGSTQTLAVTLARPGRDARLGLRKNDWVELVDDAYTLGQRAYPLLQVADVDATGCNVQLAAPANVEIHPPGGAALHPLLRRWDQRENVTARGVVAVTEGTSAAITLEAGIQVAFAVGGFYATGDYWLIPARAADNGSLDWPHAADGTPATLPPRGRHHYAVLGVNGNDGYHECCCRFDSLCAQLQSARAQTPGTVQPRVDPTMAPAPATRKATTKTARVRKPA
jgi:hypothetical protein